MSEPLYVSKATYLVSFDSRDSLGDISSQLSLASRLLYNCQIVAQQNACFLEIEEEVNKGIEKDSPQYLSKDYLYSVVSISRSSTSGTFLYVTVSAEDAEKTKKIMDVITAPGELQTVGTETVMVYPKGSFVGYMTKAFTFGTKTTLNFSLINIPEIPEKPTGTVSKKMLALVGAAAGGVVAYLVMCLYELIDKKIKSVDDLDNKYNAPVLGVLYNFESSELNYGGDKYGY
jgi:capsular polysaccharide biosynthesis protein